MDLDQFARLGTPEGAGALAAATELAAADPLAAASALRARGYPPPLAAAAMTQAALRSRAVGKFGSAAGSMFFTRTGLEQSTRGQVAERRARRLSAGGARSVVDLGCGIGADSIAFARAGLTVHAVEADPLTAAVARANMAVLGLADRVRVSTMDATAAPLTGVDAVFCDPARRTGSGRRVFDPDAYSPPWDFVAGLAGRVPSTVLKLAPGIDHALVPAGVEAEWVSVDGDVVEAALWHGPLARVPRRATVLRGPAIHTLTGSGVEQAPVGPVGAYLYDPDGAVVRAHLVAEFAATLGGVLADPTIAYVHAGAAVATPYARCYRVLERLPIALKRLRVALRAHDVGALTILKRGSAHDVERLRRELRLSGGVSATLALCRVAGAPAALLLSPVLPAG